jgi:hypothetical protein
MPDQYGVPTLEEARQDPVGAVRRSPVGGFVGPQGLTIEDAEIYPQMQKLMSRIVQAAKNPRIDPKELSEEMATTKGEPNLARMYRWVRGYMEGIHNKVFVNRAIQGGTKTITEPRGGGLASSIKSGKGPWSIEPTETELKKLRWPTGANQPASEGGPSKEWEWSEKQGARHGPIETKIPTEVQDIVGGAEPLPKSSLHPEGLAAERAGFGYNPESGASETLGGWDYIHYHPRNARMMIKAIGNHLDRLEGGGGGGTPEAGGGGGPPDLANMPPASNLMHGAMGLGLGGAAAQQDQQQQPANVSSPLGQAAQNYLGQGQPQTPGLTPEQQMLRMILPMLGIGGQGT